MGEKQKQHKQNAKHKQNNYIQLNPLARHREGSKTSAGTAKQHNEKTQQQKEQKTNTLFCLKKMQNGRKKGTAKTQNTE